MTVKDTLEVSGSDRTDSAQISGTLVLDGGQISLASTSGAINLAGTTNWSAGTLSGPGNIVNTGTINLPSGSRVVLDDNATLVNEGQLNVVGLLGLGDQYGSGAVTNKAGGTIDFLGTGNIGGGTLTNLEQSPTQRPEPVRSRALSHSTTRGERSRSRPAPC